MIRVLTKVQKLAAGLEPLAIGVGDDEAADQVEQVDRQEALGRLEAAEEVRHVAGSPPERLRRPSCRPRSGTTAAPVSPFVFPPAPTLWPRRFPGKG